MIQYSKGTKWSCSEQLLPISCLESPSVFTLEAMGAFLFVYNSSLEKEKKKIQ